MSRSLLNQAVYDRRWDWVLSIDDQPRTEVVITPGADGPAWRTFVLEARGSEIVLRFRPRFFQRHRGLRFFEPWTYRVWPQPVVGWCSWFAFRDKVTEQDIRRTADVVSEVLAPYGYEYLQIGDEYQQATGLPDRPLRAAGRRAPARGLLREGPEARRLVMRRTGDKDERRSPLILGLHRTRLL